MLVIHVFSYKYAIYFCKSAGLLSIEPARTCQCMPKLTYSARLEFDHQFVHVFVIDVAAHSCYQPRMSVTTRGALRHPNNNYR